ncbi:DNA translocase FtsK 4TM domain-containing protein, partial [Magnetococcales bacterium HHB-1]
MGARRKKQSTRRPQRQKKGRSKKKSTSTSYATTFERIREGFGWLLLSLTLFFGLSIFSYHRYDPSFNFTGLGPPENLAGISGAHLADLL